MVTDTPWIIWIIVIPLLAAILAFLFHRRAALIGVVVSILICLGIWLLLQQLTRHGAFQHSLGAWGAPLGIDLAIDGLSAVMLAMTAVIGVIVSIYSSAYFSKSASQQRYFWPLWMLLWAALNALFLSSDLFNIYVTLELLGLSAVSLAALTGSTVALGAAMRYLLVSLLGSLCYLVGVAFIYVNYGVLDISLLRGMIQPGPISWVVMALMTVGLLLKTALFPLHFWLPQAHASAPAPVSAVLSALVVKASFYLLIRLWFELFDGVVTPLAAQFVGAMGGIAILWGSLLALQQERLKLVVAYSTVAQLGYLFLAFPIVLSVGPDAYRAVIFFALSHAVAKAAMFLSTGSLMHCAGHDRISELRTIAPRIPIVMLTFGLAGISLIGLPPSGGFLAKIALLEATLESGQWWWAIIILLGGMLAAIYVFRVLALAFSSTTAVEALPINHRLNWSPVALALLALALGFIAVYPIDLLLIVRPGFGVAGTGVSP